MSPNSKQRSNELPVWIREHIESYVSTDGASGHLWDSTFIGGPGLVPTLLLTTKGRRSGEARTLPLIYGQSGADFVIIASRGGDRRHPSWYQNLCAEPRVQVQVKGDRFSAIASTVEGDERTRLWDQMCKLYPPYADYAKWAGERRIPVVKLTRSSD